MVMLVDMVEVVDLVKYIGLQSNNFSAEFATQAGGVVGENIRSESVTSESDVVPITPRAGFPW